MAKNSPVAVIDIGSNSIKVLVATRGTDGSLVPLRMRTIDARISAGISRAEPTLTEEGMTRGIEAIQSLLADAAMFSAERIVLVATSAVRDARNGAEFTARVREATGHDIRVLSGDEEANLIGRGLTADPALRDIQDFYVFDLGGGSLECLAFRARRIEQAISVPLGAVRLTEKFVADPSRPFTDSAGQSIEAHTRATLAEAGFSFTLPPDAVAVGTGGSMTTARAILGAREGKTFEAASPILPVAELRELLRWLGARPLEDRKRVPGLPAQRADILPAALTTLITVADAGGFASYRHSLYNLRYGLADEILSATTRSTDDQ